MRLMKRGDLFIFKQNKIENLNYILSKIKNEKRYKTLMIGSEVGLFQHAINSSAAFESELNYYTFKPQYAFHTDIFREFK